MSRYIDMEKLLLDIQQGVKFGQLTIVELIKQQPSIDLIRSKWIAIHDKDLGECFRCDFCNKVMPVEFPYCPWCGSLMEEDK